MNDRRKRPLGITLLALPFLWIGCIGTLIVPIFLFTGVVSQLWDAFLAEHIQSDGLRLAVATLLTLIWFGLYVFYAFIGFGLWKLRKWAWMAVVVVMWVGIGWCIVEGALSKNLFGKQPLLAVPFVLGLMVPIAAILWYLYRPHIRAAFKREVIADTTSPVSISPPFPKTSGIWLTVTIVVVVSVALFGGSMFFAIDSMFRSSAVYTMTLQAAQKSPCVIGKIGTPIAKKGMITGSMTESTAEGSADLEIPIRGPKGKAELQVFAKKSAGSWQINSLVLDQDGDQTQLLPASGAAVCQ